MLTTLVGQHSHPSGRRAVNTQGARQHAQQG